MLLKMRLTKYILHGGNAGEINNDNNSFFREMTLNRFISVLLNFMDYEKLKIRDTIKNELQQN